MIAHDLKSLDALIKSKNIVLKETFASYDVSDSDISGGRKIINVKSNQLFTGRFEERDVNDFIRIWNQYRNDNIGNLKNQLLRTSDAIIKNYHAEVCPIEVMLYTSNIISSSFSNFKLVEGVAEVIYLIWKKNPFFVFSIRHIVDVWEWEHIINVCAIAVGKICADVDSNMEAIQLMRDIFSRYRYDEQTRQGCFIGIMESKQEEFVPDILNIIHDLSGTDSDKIIGNIFKNKFLNNYPGYYGQLNAEMFANSSHYTKDLVRKIIDDGLQEKTFFGRYMNSFSKNERQEIIDESLECVRTGQGQRVFEAINLLKFVGTESVSQNMYNMLRLDNNRGKNNSILAIISYFGKVNYNLANDKMKNVKYDNDYYSACRLSLFKQSVITSDELMEGFFTETRPKQLKNYLSGFVALNDKITDVKNSSLTYFNKELNETQLKCAIGNYEKLVRKYKHLYNPLIGELFKTYFGYGTDIGTVQIRMTEQTACLNIIGMIIDSANYKKYEDFLYYVAEQGMNFAPTITNNAREILRNINSDKIKL